MLKTYLPRDFQENLFIFNNECSAVVIFLGFFFNLQGL